MPFTNFFTNSRKTKEKQYNPVSKRIQTQITSISIGWFSSTSVTTANALGPLKLMQALIVLQKTGCTQIPKKFFNVLSAGMNSPCCQIICHSLLSPDGRVDNVVPAHGAHRRQAQVLVVTPEKKYR